jgi:hypothetical protein
MPEADFLLEITVVVLERQRMWAISTSWPSAVSRPTVASQYFVGLTSSLGHSISSVSLATRASAHTGETRPQFLVGAFPPHDGAPDFLGQTERQCFDADDAAFGSSSCTGLTLVVL